MDFWDESGKGGEGVEVEVGKSEVESVLGLGCSKWRRGKITGKSPAPAWKRSLTLKLDSTHLALCSIPPIFLPFFTHFSPIFFTIRPQFVHHLPGWLDKRVLQ